MLKDYDLEPETKEKLAYGLKAAGLFLNHFCDSLPHCCDCPISKICFHDRIGDIIEDIANDELSAMEKE